MVSSLPWLQNQIDVIWQAVNKIQQHLNTGSTKLQLMVIKSSCKCTLCLSVSKIWAALFPLKEGIIIQTNTNGHREAWRGGEELSTDGWGWRRYFIWTSCSRRLAPSRVTDSETGLTSVESWLRGKLEKELPPPLPAHRLSGGGAELSQRESPDICPTSDSPTLVSFSDCLISLTSIVSSYEQRTIEQLQVNFTSCWSFC